MNTGKKLRHIKISLDDEMYEQAMLLASIEGLELAVCIRMILEEKLYGVSVRLARIRCQLNQTHPGTPKVTYA